MQIVTAIVLLLGCLILARSIRQGLRLRPFLTAQKHFDAWRFAGLLVGLFTLGYGAIAALLWFDMSPILIPLMGSILLVGAVFVHIVTYATTKLIAEHLAEDDKEQPEQPRAQSERNAVPQVAAMAFELDNSQRIRRSASQDLSARVRTQDLSARVRTQDLSARVRKYSGTFRIDETSASQPDTVPAPATILVVDDSHINRTILDSYLDRLGHRSILIGDGKSALSVLESNTSIELVLLDYWLPDMEGIEILAHMKSGELHEDTPVLMLSSEDDAETIAQCIEAGADDFLSKPFAPRLLQARIDACLSKRRFRARELEFVERLEQERKRSKELLRVILPSPIAQELTDTNRVKPRRYEHVAVMFADISGFTAYCDKHRPEDVLSHLQSIVIAFEQLAEQHRVQKIKTIGDSFMAASGLLHEVDDPVLRCVELGMEMIKVVERSVPEWDLRIGVHIGPVVAGIVGRSQFLFDIWGDTVNIASRVESSASDNGICLSASAWNEVKDLVVGESLGMVHAKGKGDIELFRVEGLRAIPAVMLETPEHKRDGFTVH